MSEAIGEAAKFIRESREQEIRHLMDTCVVVVAPEVPPDQRFHLQWRSELAIPATSESEPRRAAFFPSWTDLDHIIAVCLLPLAAGVFGSVMALPSGGWRFALAGFGVTAAFSGFVFLLWCFLIRRISTIPAIRAATEFHGRYLVVNADLDPPARKLMRRVRKSSQLIRRAVDELEATRPTQEGQITRISGLREWDTREFDWRGRRPSLLAAEGCRSVRIARRRCAGVARCRGACAAWHICSRVLLSSADVPARTPASEARPGPLRGTRGTL